MLNKVILWRWRWAGMCRFDEYTKLLLILQPFNGKIFAQWQKTTKHTKPF